MNLAFWAECRDFFQTVEGDAQCRCIVLSAAGKLFTAGLDLASGGLSVDSDSDDVARTGLAIYRLGRQWQDAFTAIEKCGKPVIACVHNACIGGGIEMISAADVRFC